MHDLSNPQDSAGEPSTNWGDWLVLRQSAIHGTGAFAKQAIRKGMPVIEYIGERIDKKESLRRCEANNSYIFSLNENEDLDGNIEPNIARFLNHSCVPNCEALMDEGRIWILAVCDIQSGEELTFNYGYDLDEYRDHPCCCASPDCVGYIVAEEFFPYLQRQNLVAKTREKSDGGE